MPVSIVIQYQEDHPHSPGWWRYGGEAEAREEAAEWDRANPRG